MATTYMTGSGGPQEGRRLGVNANSRFRMGQQEELTREKQLQDIEVGLAVAVCVVSVLAAALCRPGPVVLNAPKLAFDIQMHVCRD